MPYVLSPKIRLGSQGMWFEGEAYRKESLYSISSGKAPPVNYDLHSLKPHSLTHAEGALHTIDGGKSIDQYYSNLNYMFGNCVCVKLRGNGYKLVDPEKGLYLWEVSKHELTENLERVLCGREVPPKVILSSEFYPTNADGYHDPNYILILSKEAAEFLVSKTTFNMYGTSWKSSDYQPSSPERPIHKILFQNAIIFELLDLKSVPEGEYFFVGFPLRLEGSSESPVTPVLFEKNELQT